MGDQMDEQSLVRSAGPVFVDSSGRRGRWVKNVGYAVAGVCAVYVVVVVAVLSSGRSALQSSLPLAGALIGIAQGPVAALDDAPDPDPDEPVPDDVYVPDPGAPQRLGRSADIASIFLVDASGRPMISLGSGAVAGATVPLAPALPGLAVPPVPLVPAQPVGGAEGAPVAMPPVTTPPATTPPVIPPPVTDPPVTEPPVAEPPVTQPPVTQPPVTQPPVTQPPVTQPPVTEPPADPPPSDPEPADPPAGDPPPAQQPDPAPPAGAEVATAGTAG